MRNPIISIENIYYRYPEASTAYTLENISIELYPGEMIAILGPNGSGKSTLARLLNGLLIPTKGKVIVDGLVTSDEKSIWEIRRKVGMVFQNPDNQLVAALVQEELAFGLENIGLPPVEMKKRINEISERMELSHLLDFPPHRLSGGQKQRVAIASVLALEPEVLVLDEPTSMLDPGGRKRVLWELHRLRQMNKTLLLVTHDMSEAVMADRIIVMEKGKLALEGDPKECFANIELLANIGLELPPAAELAKRIKQKGLVVPNVPLGVKDWVEYLCLQ
ncbi:energy-coupling factor transporter ATPase [Desulfotomaculum defluvii]